MTQSNSKYVIQIAIGPQFLLACLRGGGRQRSAAGFQEGLGCLLDGRLPAGFAVPMPSDDPALREDEDPLEPGDLDLGLAPRAERTEE